MTEIKITRIQRDVKKKQGCLFKQTFWGGTGKSSCGTSSCRAVLLRLVLCPPVGKRKSDDPCRWVIAFLVPCGTGRGNDKKVNEENSKVKNKGVCRAEVAAQKRRCIQVSLLLDTTYHFRTEIARGFLKFLPKNTREIAFL